MLIINFQVLVDTYEHCPRFFPVCKTGAFLINANGPNL